ncbi:MAG: hypothetical protein U5K76_01905 [Woeseiaceae bacterium]|nr:hypothetical protein [Woeseiaceae bacterium]
MVWPLETRGARAFLRGKDEVLVVEEKRGIIESELKEDSLRLPGRQAAAGWSASTTR